jgi:hypothetical protein
MAEDGLMREKVLNHLNGLSPAARKILLRRLEAANRVHGNGSALDSLVDAARFSVTELETPVTIDVKAIIFEPFAPFIIEERLAVKQRGWVSRRSIDQIWTYVTTSAMREAFEPYLNGTPLVRGPGERRTVTAAKALGETMWRELARLVVESNDDGSSGQRFRSRVGGVDSYADLVDLLDLRNRCASVQRLLARLPATTHVGEASERILCEQVVAHVADHPDEAPYIAAGLALKVTSPSTMVKLATLIAETVDVATIRRGIAGPFMDVTLSLAECSIARFAELSQTADSTAAMVTQIHSFHDAARALVGSVNLDNDPDSRARLSQLRKTISQLIANELDGVMLAVRQGLRIDADEKPSATQSLHALQKVTILAAAIRYRESLALNELIGRLHVATGRAIEVYGGQLIDTLRKAKGDTLNDLAAVSEILLCMSEQLQGDVYAQLLRKQRDHALKRAP